MKSSIKLFFVYIFSFTLLLSLPLLLNPVHAKTVILEGRLESKISVTQQISFSVDREVSKLTFRFALPSAFSNKTVSQNLQGLNINFDPKPIKAEDETDTFGNHYKTVTWNDLNKDARINISFETHIKSELSVMESRSPFPLKDIPQNEMIYLKSTDMVQSNIPEITVRSKEITGKVSTEYEAVTAILNYVSDNVKYTYNPPQYDAFYTLKTRSGNCQNFAHLSMALLRAAGIPARIVGGISLKESWKIPVGNNNYLVQSLGQGGHAWMEIYFPDLGWLSYDPQQSKQFTSSRHIKQTHGLDSHDINDSWRASPYLPRYRESINAKFLNDTISLEQRYSDKDPRSYLLSNNLIAKAEMKVVVPPVEEKPKPPFIPPTVAPPVVALPSPPVEEKPKPVKGMMEFGNIDFPNLVDIYQVVGDQGIKIMDKETAEYVTSRYVFAQAFTVENMLTLHGISLAMRKFGGDGSLYIDIVKDEEGKPGFSGERSLPVYMSDI
ncbi:MAG: transglutaminase domain-containing protein, partial [Nitrospira sp.]|nr:transglutaminase domain-containing protein [Nitrospira sp.]